MTTPTDGLNLPRSIFIELIRTAMAEGEYTFSRQATLSWLAAYPGDLQVSLLYAKALVAEGRFQPAVSILRGLSIADPEFIPAIEALYRLSLKIEENPTSAPKYSSKSAFSTSAFDSGIIANWLYALQERNIGSSIPEYLGKDHKTINDDGDRLLKIRKALIQGDLEFAEENIYSATVNDFTSPLAAVTHLQILDINSSTPLGAKINLAEHYYKCWPDCLPCLLFLSKWLINQGDASRAVSLLHQCVTRDVSGQVAIRLWGANHPFRSLWPTQLAIQLKSQIPASVSVRMGWNQLTSQSTADSANVLRETDNEFNLLDSKAALAAAAIHNQDRSVDRTHETSQRIDPKSKSATEKIIDEDILIIKKELDKIAADINQPAPSWIDGRYPIYVIFSVYQNLVKKYGELGASLVEKAMKDLAQSIHTRKGSRKNVRMAAVVFFPDRSDLVIPYGVHPTQDLNPWGLKLSVADLDSAFARKGQMIGALLIVGGPEIVPFHNLPNPVDDLDVQVPSDNPYGTRDENYFITEWPVGRIPDGVGNEPGLLLSYIQKLRTTYLAQSNINQQPKAWFASLASWLRMNNRDNKSSLGYTAEVWKEASTFVYKPIGKPKSMLSSPPMGVNGKQRKDLADIALPSAKLGYFNLHGLVDTGEWYGQRQPKQLNENPDYPVALRPEDLEILGPNIPKFIFSEACYGAHISDRAIDDSLALKFLSLGSNAVVGSTCMSYGSVSAPLIAADLLGYLFWQSLGLGLPAGEALRQSKIKLATEMHRRQGYLDGEDQKTIISFILYGDPLTTWSPKSKSAKTIQRNSNPYPQLRTVCDRVDDPNCSNPLPIEVLPHIKNLVASYLPGMVDAKISYSHERPECSSGSHNCPTRQYKSWVESKSKPDRHLVVLRKDIQKNDLKHPVYARLTLDSTGKLVKMVVSR